MEKQINYLFGDKESGEDFIVLATNKTEATKIAKTIYKDAQFICSISEFEAACMGIDTY